MTHRSLTLLPGTIAVCRLEPGAAVPTWATTGTFFSVTRTTDELSIVCDQAVVPDGVRSERDWRCLKLNGPIPFSTVGVLASLVTPLPTPVSASLQSRHGLLVGEGREL